MSDVRGALTASVVVLAIALTFYAIDPSFFWKDDFQLQYLPGSREVARAWSEGSFPLLSPYSWFCTALGGEYQYGIFSIARTMSDLAVWSLPLSLNARAAALLFFHFAILAAGAYLLARSYAISRALALMVAVIATLNGWNLWWGTTWYPSIASFAWIPWYWLALRSAVAGRSRWSWLGVALSFYSIATAGWPFTVLMAAVMTLPNLLELQHRPRRNALQMCSGIVLGACLAAPAALMLIEYFGASARRGVSTATDFMWVVPVSALAGFVLPSVQTIWFTFIGDVPHSATELAGGFAPLAGIAAVLFAARQRFRRELRYEITLLLTLIALMLLPGANLFRWSFRWLPLIHLVLAIVGARAIDMTRDAGRSVAAAATILMFAALVLALPFDRDRASTMLLAAVLLIFCLLWWLAERREPVLLAPLSISIVTIAVMFLVIPPAREVPLWSFPETMTSRSLDPQRRYLSLYAMGNVTVAADDGRRRFGVHPELYPGNTAMLVPFHAISGYSPIGPAEMKGLLGMETHGSLEHRHRRWLIEAATTRNGFLAHLGVDGVIVPRRLFDLYRDLLRDHGWDEAARTESAVIVHRRERLAGAVMLAASVMKLPDEEQVRHWIFTREPLVLHAPNEGPRRMDYVRRRVSSVSAERLRTTLDLAPATQPGTALVVFSRPWLPGWRATLNGRPLRILRADLIMPAVEIPASEHGRLVLEYRPNSLLIGGALAIAALIAITAASLSIALRRHS